MRVLAIDTALEACSCAILDTAHEPDLIAVRSEDMTRGHAEALVPMVAAMMEEGGKFFQNIDRFAVTVGPGSFTGLRVGIAAARGFALAAGKPLVGLSTLAALAAPYMAEDETVATMAAIDARHDHVYMQLFLPGGDSTAPAIVPVQDAIAAAQAESIRIVGSAARAVAAGCSVPPLLVDERRAPDIEWVARLGAASGSDAPAKPLYLRAPDAQPQTASQLPRR